MRKLPRLALLATVAFGGAVVAHKAWQHIQTIDAIETVVENAKYCQLQHDQSLSGLQARVRTIAQPANLSALKELNRLNVSICIDERLDKAATLSSNKERGVYYPATKNKRAFLSVWDGKGFGSTDVINTLGPRVREFSEPVFAQWKASKDIKTNNITYSMNWTRRFSFEPVIDILREPPAAPAYR